MATPIRISIIGAGSAQFSLHLIKDICLTEGLAGSQVCFMDINKERLNMVHNLAVRFAGEMGADLRFESVPDIGRCLDNTDFVINTAYIKGHHHEWNMRNVAAGHGYYYDGVQLGDFYQLSMSLNLAREMEKACPDAWLIQSANPVFNTCTLMTRETGIRVCGLCHGHYHYKDIARTIGIDPERVTWQAPGFNHNIWLTHFIYEGKYAYPLIDEWIQTQGEAYWRNHVATHTHDVQMSRGAVNQYHMYGLFPIGDTVRRVGAGYTVGCTIYRGEWWYHTDLNTKKYWFGEPWGGPDTHPGRKHFGKLLEKTIADMIEAADNPKKSIVLEDLLSMEGHEEMNQHFKYPPNWKNFVDT